MAVPQALGQLIDLVQMNFLQPDLSPIRDRVLARGHLQQPAQVPKPVWGNVLVEVLSWVGSPFAVLLRSKDRLNLLQVAIRRQRAESLRQRRKRN